MYKKYILYVIVLLYANFLKPMDNEKEQISKSDNIATEEQKNINKQYKFTQKKFFQDINKLGKMLETKTIVQASLNNTHNNSLISKKNCSFKKNTCINILHFMLTAAILVLIIYQACRFNILDSTLANIDTLISTLNNTVGTALNSLGSTINTTINSVGNNLSNINDRAQTLQNSIQSTNQTINTVQNTLEPATNSTNQKLDNLLNLCKILP